jgi:hypothetical protein
VKAKLQNPATQFSTCGRSEVLMAVGIKMAVCWVVAWCSLVEVH